MRLETLCFLSGLEPPADPGDAEREISAVTCHSRTCVPGCIYVCIRGTRVDGHAFIEEALAKGAAAVVTEQDHPMVDGFVNQRGSAVFLSCQNTREAVARLYHAWYGDPSRDMTLVAVTGTNGKTTVSTMLAAVLQRAGIAVGLIGTVGCVCRGRTLCVPNRDETANMTTPDPEQLYHILAVMAREGVRVVVMEASSHALALKKLAPLHFALSIFTNFTQDHLDFHGSMEAYWQAKSSLLLQSEMGVLNTDDPAIAALHQHAPCPTIGCGTQREADYIAREIKLHGVRGVSYILRGSSGEELPMLCPIPGAFTVSNSQLAAVAAMKLGVPREIITAALGSFCGVPGRMERMPLGEKVPFSVLIDYAHTPDALQKLLLCAQGFRCEGERIVLVFGCGGDRDRSKRPIMAQIAASLADVVYLTSDNSRSENPEDILDDLVRGMPKGCSFYRIVSRAEAITQAIWHARAGDIILLAGKGHEKYEIDRAGKHPFDEREIVRAAMDLAWPDGKKADGADA